MQTKLVPIGNSRGIRIPKAIIEQFGFQEDVELEAHPEGLLVRPVRKARNGWDAAFAKMRRRGDDQLIDFGAAAQPRFDREDWKW